MTASGPFRIYLLSFLLTVVFPASGNKGNPEYKLIVFEGSDWCVNCIRFEKTILSDALFINYTNRNHIEIERIDFPQHKKLSKSQIEYNTSVAEKYAFEGLFPTIILAKTGVKRIIKIDYNNQNSEELISLIQIKIQSF